MQKKCGENTMNEIYLQPERMENVLKDIDEITNVTKKIIEKNIGQVIFIGCGTSYYIAASASYYFQKKTKIISRFLSCYEFELNSEIYINDLNTLVVPFSRIASTTEVYRAIEKAKTLDKVHLLHISCDETAFNYSNDVILCRDVSEKSIVMTSSFTSMLLASMIFTNIFAGESNEDLLLIPNYLEKQLKSMDEQCRNIANDIKDCQLFVCLGQGDSYGIVGEASIKVKEMCLLPTEVYYSLEYRHGPISLADKNTVVLMISTSEFSNEEVILAKDLKKLGVTLLVSGNKVSEELLSIADHVFAFDPKFNEDILPLLIVPNQLLGAHLSLNRNLNPDYPRNLAASVVIQ